jgi:hypothetical protein
MSLELPLIAAVNIGLKFAPRHFGEVKFRFVPIP